MGVVLSPIGVVQGVRPWDRSKNWNAANHKVKEVNMQKGQELMLELLLGKAMREVSELWLARGLSMLMAWRDSRNCAAARADHSGSIAPGGTTTRCIVWDLMLTGICHVQVEGSFSNFDEGRK